MAIWEPFNSSSQRLMTSIVSANRISQTHTRLSFTLSIPWIYLVISLQRLFIQNNISKHTRTHNVTDTKFVSTQYFQSSTLLDEMGWDGVVDGWVWEFVSRFLISFTNQQGGNEWGKCFYATVRSCFVLIFQWKITVENGFNGNWYSNEFISLRFFPCFRKMFFFLSFCQLIEFLCFSICFHNAIDDAGNIISNKRKTIDETESNSRRTRKKKSKMNRERSEWDLIRWNHIKIKVSITST